MGSTMDDRPALAKGEALHRAGDLVRAEEVYRAVLRSDPADAQAWFLLGVVCQVTGRVEEAVSSFRRAIRIRSEHAPTWNLLGVSLAGLGRPGEAEACFRRVLQIQPRHPEAARNLERARRAQGGALGADVGRLLPTGPETPAYADCCRRAYEFCEKGRFFEAEPWIRDALAIRPDSADLLNDLGKVLVLQSRSEEGLASFRRAIAVEPDHARAHLNLAAALFDLERAAEAEPVARRAAQLEPGNPSSHNNLGLILAQLGRLTAAECAIGVGLEIAPDHADLLANLGNVLVLQGRAEEAQDSYRRALELKPGDHAARSNWLMSRHYLAGVDSRSLLEDHRGWDLRHAASLRATWRPFRNDRDPERPLRLGFVSADFRRHPVGYFVVRVMEGLLPLDCETYVYQTGSGNDGLTARIASASTVWRASRGLSDDELAEQIRADRIDLLFDLAGHTSKNRLLVFARKPAPIQLSWVGYEGTTGLSAMDYLLADRDQVPVGTELYYEEKVVRLPDGYVCWDPPVDAPDVGPPPSDAWGSVTFGCFNNPAKVGPGVIATWAEILLRVPGSRLILKYRGLDDDGIGRRFLGLFSDHGIDPGRVQLSGWSPFAEMMAEYGKVDIALDPFPFSGCLTTCLALWMGVPVVTWPGETFAGRHSLSLLSIIGINETVAADRAGYVEIAVGLASDRTHLAELRAGLRSRMLDSPLCDGDRFGRSLLEVLRESWREWCNHSA